MKTIIQAHEVCSFRCWLIAYENLYSALEKNAHGYFEKNEFDRKYFLELKQEKDGKYKFDFIYVPRMKDISGAIIKPVFPDDGDNLVGIEVLVDSDELGDVLKAESAKLNVTFNENTIQVNKERFLRYQCLYYLLNAYRKYTPGMQPLQSKLFLA